MLKYIKYREYKTSSKKGNLSENTQSLKQESNNLNMK